MVYHLSFDKFVTLVKKLFQIQNDLVFELMLIDQHESKDRSSESKPVCSQESVSRLSCAGVQLYV